MYWIANVTLVLDLCALIKSTCSTSYEYVFPMKLLPNKIPLSDMYNVYFKKFYLLSYTTYNKNKKGKKISLFFVTL